MEENDQLPLDYLLNLNVLVRENFLPLIEPSDLATLESVNKRCNVAIKENELWRTKMTNYLKDDIIASRIFIWMNVELRKYLEECPKYLYRVLLETERRVAFNIRQKYFLSSTFSCKDTRNDQEDDGDKYYRAIVVHTNGGIIFAAHDKNVDVLQCRRGGGMRLDFLRHVSWGQDEAEIIEETTVVRELDLYARFISVVDDLLFIAHFGGTITAWNWKLGRFLTNFRGHLLRKSFASPIKSFKVKGSTIAVGFLDGWVAILEFNKTELKIRDYIDPSESGVVHDLRAVDLDEKLVALGYGDRIVIWDVDTTTFINNIPWENDNLIELHFNAKKQKILVGDIFSNEFSLLDIKRGVRERRFFIPDDAMMTTLTTDWRHHVVAGTWEAGIYAWRVGDAEDEAKPIKIYQSETASVKHISQRSYRASGINHINFNGIHLAFIECFGMNVKLLDFVADFG